MIRFDSDYIEGCIPEILEALQKTKFGCVDMKQLLEAYFEEPVVTKEEKRQMQQGQQAQFHTRILSCGKELGVDGVLMKWLRES